VNIIAALGPRAIVRMRKVPHYTSEFDRREMGEEKKWFISTK